MFGFKRRFRSRRSSHAAAIREDQTRTLEQAEADLEDLQRRAAVAMRVLDTRDRRNHWQQSVADMIQGV